MEHAESETKTRSILTNEHNNNTSLRRSSEDQDQEDAAFSPSETFDDEPVLGNGLDHDDDDGSAADQRSTDPAIDVPWAPSGKWWRDMLHFVGPGWFVSIAYVDPGNYQADIQAGATSRYSLLFVVWWTSILSIYVQILCVRLAYYSGLTLAEAQARHAPTWMRYLNWFLAEFSTVITDLPEVIGIGIACHIFFGWDYYVGVCMSLLTTMCFLATLNFGMRILEGMVFVFVAIMSLALFAEMDFVGVDKKELLQGWLFGFQQVTSQDIFAVTGVIGAVVMPHNLYLHTAACQSRPVQPQYVKQAVRWSSWEPVLPILVSFFVNMAIVAIAAEKVYGQPGAENVGLTDFCDYFSKLKWGCALWGIALLAAGQSSAITTTYTGQYVMDGFLKINLPLSWRAIVTRLVAITPCIIVSVALPNQLNRMVNIVNSSLSFLLPFAFTPLVKYNCSPEVMGPNNASRGVEKVLLHVFAISVWLINAVAFSVQGGGFFGDLRTRLVQKDASRMSLAAIWVVEISIQVFYAWWNWSVLRSPMDRFREIAQQDSMDEDGGVPYIGENNGELGGIPPAGRVADSKLELRTMSSSSAISETSDNDDAELL